jgi:hypothetical protein
VKGSEMSNSSTSPEVAGPQNSTGPAYVFDRYYGLGYPDYQGAVDLVPANMNAGGQPDPVYEAAQRPLGFQISDLAQKVIRRAQEL